MVPTAPTDGTVQKSERKKETEDKTGKGGKERKRRRKGETGRGESENRKRRGYPEETRTYRMVIKRLHLLSSRLARVSPSLRSRFAHLFGH